ncbi:MAG: HNH endonuclease, partial [Candidatus Jordarchaeales archaeon]
MNIERMLVALRAWSHWYLVVSRSPKYLPGLSLLEKGFETAEKSLRSESRKTVLRLAKMNTCVACGSRITIASGDHIIPLSKGGPQSAENFMPLCKRCNSSKGNRDLLEWWLSLGRHIKDLNPDVLTIYLRLAFRLKAYPPPGVLVEAVRQAGETLP